MFKRKENPPKPATKIQTSIAKTIADIEEENMIYIDEIANNINFINAIKEQLVLLEQQIAFFEDEINEKEQLLEKNKVMITTLKSLL